MAVATRSAALAEGSVATRVGTVHVTASPDGVREVWLPSWRERTGSTPADIEQGEALRRHVERRGDPAAERHLQSGLDELAEYFAGDRQEFTVALDPQGPEFYRHIWAEVARVPFGETRSYGEIARVAGVPQAVRAVGAANGANPVPPFVPCHRVVGSDGRLTGYGPGLPLKQWLLEMEDAVPSGPDDYSAWISRLRARMGSGPLFLGVRGTGVFCRVECVHAMPQRCRPGRIFRSAGEAAAAGFRPCGVCRPDGGASLIDMMGA
ncbi:MAG TPA: methylated-DNA--[protein]-cysteine S-methyltransferase [Ktedonobacterales bacterium]